MKLLVVANWKMNPQSLVEAKSLFKSISRGLKDIKKRNLEVVVCPPFLYLSILGTSTSARRGASYGGLTLGSQDCFWEGKGAFTGEISPLMLRNLDCQYVILGHSERRRYIPETDENINKKITAVLKSKLNPIFCIGETQGEKNGGKTQKVLSSQIRKGLKGIVKKEIKKVVFAYEPVWAIGTGNPCLPVEGKRVIDFIRKTVAKIYDRKISEKISILYGGSVNSQNAAPYIFEAGFQGLLVGGASLDAREFIRLIKNIALY